jgi:hypothetical protein
VREAAGPRFEELEMHVNASVVHVGDGDASSAVERVAARTGRTTEEVWNSPATLVGSVEAIIDRLLERRESFGVSYYVVQGRAMEAFAPVVARLAKSD